MSMQLQQQNMPGELRLTSTTAPAKVFSSRSELAAHYKSDWHRYNLKRREAGLPMLREEDFQARLEAALALRREREGREERSGRDHLKDKDGGGASGGKKKNKKEKKNARGKNKKGWQTTAEGDDGGASMAIPAGVTVDGIAPTTGGAVTSQSGATDEEMTDVGGTERSRGNEGTDERVREEPPAPEINPRQCLFDSHVSPTVASNVARMQRKYGFFVPDAEYLTDVEGFVGYCAEKVKLGHYCLYCQKVFPTWTGCQKHMVAKRHAKVRYERGIDLEEFDVFYDFSEADAEFLGDTSSGVEKKKKMAAGTGIADEEDVYMEDDVEDDDDSAEWEDVTDDEDEEVDESTDAEENDADDLYAGYRDEIKNYGLDVTPLGELVFPDGRIVGHRGLAKYYKQRFVPDHNAERAAVIAARRAAGERVIGGRVYNVRAAEASPGQEGEGETTLALARAGLAAGAARGRSGKGILVSTAAGGRGGFTTLSLYRYKAAVKKQRREDDRGRRLQHRTQYNMNRMDKKANRLMNGVSVAHAPR